MTGTCVCVCVCVLFLSFFSEYKRIKLETNILQLLAWEYFYFIEIFLGTQPYQLCLQNIFLFVIASPSFEELPLALHQTMLLGAGSQP